MWGNFHWLSTGTGHFTSTYPLKPDFHLATVPTESGNSTRPKLLWTILPTPSYQFLLISKIKIAFEMLVKLFFYLISYEDGINMFDGRLQRNSMVLSFLQQSVSHRDVALETENLKGDKRIQLEVSILAVAALMPKWPLNEVLPLVCILETCCMSHTC